MPLKFNQFGISFQYPDNWTLDDEELTEESRSVTVYSPGGAFWTVAIHPREADLQELASATVEVMKQEYEQLESEVVSEMCLEWELTGFNFSFFYLDLTSTAQFRGLKSREAIYTIFCEAEDREFVALQKVFRAMTVSLLQGIE